MFKRTKKYTLLLLVGIGMCTACGDAKSGKPVTSSGDSAGQESITDANFESEPSLIKGDTLFYQSTADADVQKVVINRKTGQKRKEYHLYNGEMQGGYVLWFSNNETEEEGQYTSGEKTGNWKEYYYYDHQLAKDVNYKAGKLEGHFMEFHANGNKKLECNYVNGKREGNVKEWWENGSLKTEMGSKNDKPDGPSILWHSNGQKNAEGVFDEGKRIGKMMFWFENGQEQRLINYDEKGQPHGNTKVWSPAGKLLMEGVYEHGELVEETTY